jgi:hypothetical protein
MGVIAKGSFSATVVLAVELLLGWHPTTSRAIKSAVTLRMFLILEFACTMPDYQGSFNCAEKGCKLQRRDLIGAHPEIVIL